jgi:glycosyltransferase involved in cell wall biosynthesis
MKKITVNSHLVEFGYELLAALPYAKWLSDNGMLEQTISGIDTKSLYYFSENHTEINKERSFNYTSKMAADGIPNTWIHTPHYDWSKWSNPNFEQKYKNEVFKYDKPIICLCNRVNIEWGRGVINYFDIKCLDKICQILKNDYQIIYFNINGKKEYYDGVDAVDIGDYDFLKKNHPEVKIIHDIHNEHSNYSFNELQLMVFANSNGFITMNGGYSILASYFKKTNIIYTKECRELASGVNEFYRTYPKLGGSRIVLTRSYNDIYEAINTHFIEKKPCVNILIRTSNRPNYFERCIKSIENQDYRNINIVVSVENRKDDEYCIKHPCITHYVNRLERKVQHEFPYNLYFNELRNYCYDGFILHIDDDDMLLDNKALSKIVEKNADVLLWKVKIGDSIYPSYENFGKQPVKGDISGIGFAVKTGHWIEWNKNKCGDFEVINKLFQKNNISWLDEVLTGSQERNHNGNRSDLLINSYNYMDNKVLAQVTEKGCKISKVGDIIELPQVNAKELETKGLVKIVKNSNIVSIEITSICMAFGKRYIDGQILEMEFGKAIQMSRNGLAIMHPIIEPVVEPVIEPVVEPVVEQKKKKSKKTKK